MQPVRPLATTVAHESKAPSSTGVVHVHVAVAVKVHVDVNVNEDVSTSA
jgi:hypothetical protein